MKEGVGRLAEEIVKAEEVVVFTGAGVSTESGIPDFRSPGGLWSRYDPSDFYFGRFLSSEDSRRKYWQMYKEFFAVLHRAKPNPAHYACCELWQMGKLTAVITQNVDGLHQASGLPQDKVVELHGNATRVRCLDCGRTYPSVQIEEWLRQGVEVPRCEGCGGLLKPATISFGQAMPEEEVRLAERYARGCDLFISVGSSLLVHPAALMPLFAKEAGARLVIVNLSETPYDGRADLLLRGRAAEVLPEAVRRAKELLTSSRSQGR